MSNKIDEPQAELHLGDCLQILKTLKDNSVDAIVTDPPAGIAFMGKEWDKNKGGRDSWIKWMQEISTECLRVIKPGGHAFVWAIPRTSHWTATAWENAGFDIRDVVAHVFGCLSEDTEILTINGWEHYHKDLVLNPVLCYNVDKNSFEFHKPLRDFIYENTHTAYRIKSDKTDQIVSRNHRVLVERGGRKVFAQAETLERQENIPFLESLPDLSKAVHDYHERTGNKEKVLSRMSDSRIKTKTQRKIQVARKSMSLLWKNISGKIQSRNSEVLLSQLQSNSSIRKAFDKVFSFGQGWLDRREYEKLSNKNDRREKSSVERRSNLFQEKGQLRQIQDKISALSARVFRYGEKRQLCYGTPFDNGLISREVLNQNRSGASYQSQPRGQSDRESDVIPNKQSPQITRGTITPIEYKGKVWCVEVPTGAFIARRNGQVFITGNSGFPKSHNIGKSVNQLETKEWLNIGKALDNIEISAIIEVWKNNLNNVKIVATQSEKSIIEIGMNTLKSDSAQENATGNLQAKNNYVSAIIAELNLCEALLLQPETKELIAIQNVEANTKQLQDPAKSVEQLSQSRNHKSLSIFTAQCDVKEWLKENTVVNHKVEEALKTLRGNKKYSNEEIINVLNAVIPSVLKHTILNQSKTFQSLDTNQKMECASAINVIITEYTAECLITNTVAILKSKAVDKLQGNEREVVGKDRSGSERKCMAGDFTGGEYDLTKGTSEYEGWGTALKPAREDWLLMRKPLTDGGLDIVKTVCHNIRENSLITNGDNILWRIKNVKNVGKQKTRQTSSLTEQQKTVEVSVRTVSESEKQILGKRIESLLGIMQEDTEKIIEKSLTKEAEYLTEQTKNESLQTEKPINENEKRTPLSPMEESANVVESQDLSSLPLTTSEVVEENTEKKLKEETSTPFLNKQDTQKTDLDCSVATATSQWVCMDIVRTIKVSFENKEYDFEQLSDGSLIWNDKLKPYREPKPLNVASNCLKWGTGGINIDESRVEFGEETDKRVGKKDSQKGASGNPFDTGNNDGSISTYKEGGRWPANLIHDNSEEVRDCFPDAGKGNGKGTYNYAGREYDNKDKSMFNGDKPQAPSNFNDSGNASRFFKSIIYQSKASKKDRGEGNTHPTVKPIKLMEYLVKMISRDGATVLDPFLGSGSTGVAAVRSGRKFIGIEMNPEYLEIAERRINHET